MSFKNKAQAKTPEKRDSMWGCYEDKIGKEVGRQVREDWVDRE